MGRNLRTGMTKSCGCYNREQPMTHGKSGTKLYTIWKGIINRCNGFTKDTQRLYKDKGIKVCERWKEFENFEEDMGAKYEEHVNIYGEDNTTIDRIDGDKGYYLDNCRWATYEVQSRNRRFRNEHPGVVKRGSKWRVNIGVGGKQIHLGTFDDYHSAVEVRKDAEEKYWRND